MRVMPGYLSCWETSSQSLLLHSWRAMIMGGNDVSGTPLRGVPFSPSDAEPEDVDWINNATRPLIHAVPPRATAELALRLAEETDRRVASLPSERMWPNDASSPVNPLRAAHRGEHLDEIEAALEASQRSSTT